MKSVKECYIKVKSACNKFIYSQETKTEKFKKKKECLKSF